jgi:hypothetical protein
MNLNQSDRDNIKKEIMNNLDWKNLLKDFHDEMVGEEEVDRIYEEIKKSDNISE